MQENKIILENLLDPNKFHDPINISNVDESS